MTRATRAVERLTQLADAAGTVAEIARSTQVHRFPMTSGAIAWLHIAHAEVTLIRHDMDEIAISAVVSPPLVWQIAAEQDNAGIYYVALRRPIVGAVGLGRFEIRAPRHAALILKLESVRFIQDDLTTTLDLPAAPSIGVK